MDKDIGSKLSFMIRQLRQRGASRAPVYIEFHKLNNISNDIIIITVQNEIIVQ